MSTFDHKPVSRNARGPLRQPYADPLQVSRPGDVLEREADAAAERFMAGAPLGARLSRAAGSPIQRRCAACDAGLRCTSGCTGEDPVVVQRKASDSRGAGALSSAILPHQLGAGRPLAPTQRAPLERHFGFDFANVRVHADAAAAASARALHASAYTVGHHLVFAAGQYEPSSAAGRRLLAHELAHVVQQSSGAGPRIQRQPDPAASGGGGPAYGPEQAIPLALLGNPPAGVGLRVPVHPMAVTGIHDWSGKYGVPEGRADVKNIFTVGRFRLQQVLAIDAMEIARVYVYLARAGDQAYAVGPDSLIAFVVTQGGVITARPGNRDMLSRPVGMDARKLPAAPFAFNEEPQLVYVAPLLPIAHEPDVPPMPFEVGPYLMRPYVRQLGNGTWSVLYYVASRKMSEFGGKYRDELVVGPLWLDFFSERVEYFYNIAVLGFFTLDGGPPPEYVRRSARYVYGTIWHGDPERAREGLKAWKAAIRDPGWWIQIGFSYVGATEPAPRSVPTGPPQLRIVPRESMPATPAPAAPVRPATRVAPTVAPTPMRTAAQQPVVVTGGGAARVLDTMPAPAPVAAAPAAAPRPGPRLVTGPLGTPPVAPPSRVAAAAAAGAIGAAPGKSIGVKPQPAPAPDKDKKKKKDERGGMRHQIQQGLHKHFSSVAVAALDDNGVTGRQLRDTMQKNFMLYMAIARGQQPVPDDWTKGPVGWESPIRRAIISQSKAITDLVASGGIDRSGDVNSLRRCFDPSDGSPTDCDSNDVRLDIENRGHNLRRE